VGTSLAAEPLLALAVKVTSEQRVESVLQGIVRGLAAQPGVALARIWLLPSADLHSFCQTASVPHDCLCLAASAGTPINSPGEDWSYLDGHFARVPFSVGKVGQVAATRCPILIEEVAPQNDWVVRPDWAKREEICSFAGHPLIFRDKLLGVIAVFSRQRFGEQEFTWLGLFANQAAVAIANARAEEALQLSERNLRQMINAIPAMIHTSRGDGYLDYFNLRWLDYLGCSLNDVEGWKWTGWIHPDDLQGMVAKWRECLANGEIFEYETRVRRSDGQYRWMFHRKVPLRDERGIVVRWYGTSLDVEDRKRSQEALRNALDEIQKSESKLRQVIDTIPALAWCNLPDGPNEFLNKGWHEYTGLSGEESHGWGWQAAFHPDDLPPLMEKWLRMLTSGEPDEIEARLRRHDGVYRWFLIRAQPFRDEFGKIVRWYGTSTDIDDRKRAEAQLEQAYLRLAEAQRLSKTGSFAADLLAEDPNWSEEALRIFEFEPSTKVTVMTIRDIVHPEDLPTFDAVIARGIAGNDIDFVFRIVTARAGIKHIRGMARVMTQPGSHPLFIGAVQDVTDSKLAEEALNRARTELAEVARVTTLNTLTASIAHEINQPLSGIITNANTCVRMLSADPPNTDGACETAKRTIRDANRASEVITRLRTLYSKKELSLESMDLNEAAREVIALLSDQLQRKRVLLLTDFDNELPPVAGDRVQLQQVILNLLRNAAEAMSAVDDRPRELVITTARGDGDRVHLSVKDSGVGLDRLAADRLFQPFYTTKNDGMGIGLSISRSIIEAHEGRLWATPNDGPGATFSFSIPEGKADLGKACFAIGFLSNGDELRWMPEVVRILRDEFPDVDVTTSTNFSPLLAEAVSGGQLDAAFMRREEGWPELAYETLLSTPLQVYLPKNHRLAALQEVSPQDLVGETFLGVANTAPVLRRILDDYLQRCGIRLAASHELDHPGKAMSFIACSGGVGIMPAYLEDFLPESVVTRPLKGSPPTIDLVLGYKESNESPILKFLLANADAITARVSEKQG
jgi:PAS domain S-box-containing protein